MSHIFAIFYEDIEMAQVQGHEKLTLRCLFDTFDSALESHNSIFLRKENKNTKILKIISWKNLKVLYFFDISPLKAKIADV